MTTYKYKARTAEGMEVKGVVQATDEFEAAAKIRQTTPIIISITPVKESQGLLSMEIGSDKFNMKSLSIACSQIAITLKSGIPLARCLDLIGNQTDDKKMRKLLISTAEDVSEGNQLATSLERNGKSLPITFIETIRSGEESGNIERSFEEMATYYDKANKTQQKVKQALSYPIFVIVIAIIVLIIVMVKVIPTLAATFMDLGGDLPLITKIMIDTSNFFAKWWGVMALIVVLIALIWRTFVKTPRGREVQGQLQLHMPVLGKIHRMNGAAEFATTMAMLLNSGLTVNRAVEITAKTLDNYIMQNEISDMVGKIEEGHQLGECMHQCESFPKTLREMCAIGEETGELDSTLKVIGDFYTNEADVATKSALDKLEPAMLIGLAIFAGFIVFAIYMPMFTMYNLM